MISFPLQFLLPDFQWKHTLFTVSNIATTQVLFADPTRYAVLWGQSTGGSVTVGTNAVAAINDGMSISANTNAQIWTFQDLGPLLSLDWYAVATNAGVRLPVFEVFYRPKVEE